MRPCPFISGLFRQKMDLTPESGGFFEKRAANSILILPFLKMGKTKIPLLEVGFFPFFWRELAPEGEWVFCHGTLLLWAGRFFVFFRKNVRKSIDVGGGRRFWGRFGTGPYSCGRTGFWRRDLTPVGGRFRGGFCVEKTGVNLLMLGRPRRVSGWFLVVKTCVDLLMFGGRDCVFH